MLRFGPHDHETGVRQDFEVMRNGRLRERKPLRHLSARQLTRGGELAHHSKTVGVPERLENADELEIFDRLLSHR